MLSRLALRHVTATPSILLSAKNGASACALVVRDYASESPKPVPVTSQPRIKELTIKETVANWDAANKLFYGPDRDLVNFPTLVRPESVPPVRFGFIPDSWFRMLYEKTGVTGPYVFGVGFISFLFSKEIWVYEHQFTNFVAFWILFYILTKKFGPQMRAYVEKLDEGLSERHWYKPMRETVESMEKVVNDTEKMIWREEGQKYLYQSKRENVDLQLEAVYRQRLAEVGQAVKKRLEYHLDVENTRRRIHQQHMVQWIVDGVIKGITPQQEKDSLAKCIQELKLLSAQQSPETA